MSSRSRNTFETARLPMIKIAAAQKKISRLTVSSLRNVETIWRSNGLNPVGVQITRASLHKKWLVVENRILSNGGPFYR